MRGWGVQGVGGGGRGPGLDKKIIFGRRMFAVPNGHAGSLLIGRSGPY